MRVVLAFFGCAVSSFVGVQATPLGIRRFWDPKVDTPLGVVEGFTDGNVNVFHSIPFAKAPTGDLRFRTPVPIDPWNGTLDVKAMPNLCPQLDFVAGIHLGEEDCLYTHVYVPKTNTTGTLPVLFWIFGGGFSLGDGDEFGWYSGRHLAERHNVIVVAPNYRVNAFGFFAHPALQDEDAQGSTGNYGIQDQRLALQWVQDNIASFGGDPARVTIFGESAGAMSVCHHFANPSPQPMFHAAIMESGTCDAPQFFVPLEKAVEWSTTFAAAMGCNQSQPALLLKCIRGKSTTDFMASIISWLSPNWPFKSLSDSLNQTYGVPLDLLRSGTLLPPFAPVMPWGPAVDGTLSGLPDMPLTLIRQKKNAPVPLIVGTNANEGAIFVPASPLLVRNVSFPLTPNDTAALIRRSLEYTNSPYDVSPVLDAYPSSDYKNSEEARCADMITDFMFKCPSRRVARALNKNGQRAFLFQFTYKNKWIDIDILGDYHTSELSFVFDNQWPPILHTFSQRDQEMSDTFQMFWGTFAHTGDPNKYAMVEDDCSWNLLYGMCTPSPRCSYQFKFGDLTLSESCRLKTNYTVWPSYDLERDENIVMDVPLGIKAGLGDKCDMWDTFLGV